MLKQFGLGSMLVSKSFIEKKELDDEEDSEDECNA